MPPIMAAAEDTRSRFAPCQTWAQHGNGATAPQSWTTSQNCRLGFEAQERCSSEQRSNPGTDNRNGDHDNHHSPKPHAPGPMGNPAEDSHNIQGNPSKDQHAKVVGCHVVHKSGIGAASIPTSSGQAQQVPLVIAPFPKTSKSLLCSTRQQILVPRCPHVSIPTEFATPSSFRAR